MVKSNQKVQAVFGQGNIDRVRRIVEAKGSPIELALISPSFIVMDLTWKCNYRCGACIDGNVVNQHQSRKDLPVELIEDIFDYSHKHGVRGIMTMGGEVFLYKNGIKKALEKSIEYQIPVKTVTNGSQLNKFIPEIVEAYKIPGSMLRVSINSDSEHYQEQTGQSHTKLEEVLESIYQITSQGTPVYVSTVIFPESSESVTPCGGGIIQNIDQLENIIQDCEKAGVKTHILMPARSPQTRSRYHRNDKERAIMKEIADKKYKTELESGEFVYKKKNQGRQNLDFNPCPSGYIFTLIGSDGRIYKCTDNRGKDSAVIGQIKQPRDFEKFWHSEDRVNMQKCTQCTNEGCIRYKVNCMLNAAITSYKERGEQGDILDFFEQPGGRDKMFI